ncbi:radical SAM protein [Patescibacteria group bacterium]
MQKIIRFAKFISELKQSRDFPRVVNYDITSKCNLNCEHCYWRKTYDSRQELSEEVWTKTFQEHRRRGATTAYITGGEPMLRPRLVAAADKIFPEVVMVSNGIIKIPKNFERRVMISIDGPEEIHNKIRGQEVFAKIIGNIKNDQRVILTPTLSTTNYQYIEDLVDITREANVDGIAFSTYTSHQGSEDPYYLKGNKLDWTVNKMLEIWRDNKDIVFLTPSVINSWRQKNYSDTCYFKGDDFVAFDANLNIKKPCTLGAGVKCETCGCIVPVYSAALKRFDIRAWFVFDRFFPARYSQEC